jgi:hypothetical protein
MPAPTVVQFRAVEEGRAGPGAPWACSRSRTHRSSLTYSDGIARIPGIMTRRQPYVLSYARGVTKHLKSIDAKYDNLIRDTIEEQLRFQPGIETKNRKPLRQPTPFAAQ